MKRKIDKNKVYSFIGRAVTYLSIYMIVEIGFIKTMMYVLDNCITTI